jgi:hypothetical protein
MPAKASNTAASEKRDAFRQQNTMRENVEQRLARRGGEAPAAVLPVTIRMDRSCSPERVNQGGISLVRERN